MRELILSLQDWEVARGGVNEGIKDATCDEIFRASTVVLSGVRYVSFEANYGPYHDDPAKAQAIMHAWQVVPACEYEGVTFRNFEALSPNVPGLVIISEGVKYVCAEYVRVRMGLPNVPILSMDEAISMNSAQRRVGWRYLMYEDVEPEWDTFCGHPVVIYGGVQPTVALLWKSKFGVLHDYFFDDGVVLDSCYKDEAAETECISHVMTSVKEACFTQPVNDPWCQLKLFV